MKFLNGDNFMKKSRLLYVVAIFGIFYHNCRKTFNF